MGTIANSEPGAPDQERQTPSLAIVMELVRPEPARALGADSGAAPAHHRRGALARGEATAVVSCRRDDAGRGQQRPQPRALPPLPDLGPAGLRLLRCGLYDHGQGPLRLRGRRSKGTCSNDRTISRPEIEARILKALKQKLLTPELVAEFTRAYREEVNRLAKEADCKAQEDEAMELIHSLIDKIVLTPREEGVLMRFYTAIWPESSRCVPNSRKPPRLSPSGAYHCRWLRGQDLNL